MRILVFHGYLLGGTGSNVYNARLARTLVELGHEVHLLAQERHPQQHPFVDAAGAWEDGSLKVRALKEGPARCTLYRPEIGGLLPVYVEDRYEGIEARSFLRCSEAEIERYIAANVAAVSEVSDLVDLDIALANHVVMGPVVLARALRGRVPYAVKVHGSALEYTVKRDAERFLPFAREGIEHARGVIVGSSHTGESLLAALGEDWTRRERLRERLRLGPPGVDVHAFAPRSPERAALGLSALASRLRATAEASSPLPGIGSGLRADMGTAAGAGPSTGADAAAGANADTGADAGGDAFARDDSAAAQALAEIAAGRGPLVGYVGKLIVSKGVDLLIASWPLLLEEVPDARLLIVGFGSLREPLEGLLGALGDGDLDRVRAFALEARELEGGERRPLSHLQAFVDSLRGDVLRSYLQAASGLPRQVCFAGRLDHGELVDVLPACEALVMPSTFPEAFGMVAAEAAACGALPVSAAHSGLAEVSGALARAVPDAVAPLLSFEVGDRSVHDIASRLAAWLKIDPAIRESARSGIVETVRERWSWEGVAAGVIAAAQGAPLPSGTSPLP